MTILLIMSFLNQIKGRKPKNLHTNVNCSFDIGKCYKQSKCPSAGEEINKHGTYIQ